MNTAFLVGTPLSANTVGGGGGSFLYNAWQQNTAIRFGTSGILGNAIFFGLDRILFPVIMNAASKLSASNISKWISQNAASVSFFVAYLLDIAVQHLLNAWLVFGLETINTRQLYLSSLATSYTAYFGTLCGSTILQAFLIQHGVSKADAFWITIALGSIINYIVLTSLNATKKTDEQESKCYNSSNTGTQAMIPIWGIRKTEDKFIHDYFTNSLSDTGSHLRI